MIRRPPRPPLSPYTTPSRSGGEVDEPGRNRLMSHAVAMLHPVTWREPFGLTIIEAMATGCPVIGINMGSIPEIIVQGRTGFMVNDVDEMTDAVANIGSINREDCRAHVLENFSAARMADGYEEIYQQITAPKESAPERTQGKVSKNESI